MVQVRAVVARGEERLSAPEGVSGTLTMSCLLIQVLVTQMCSLFDASSICNVKIFTFLFLHNS